jgi:UDP-4-amino-4,6-dideoxy-N-acetyl-beta-L-altrosamine transaminase
MIPYGKHHIDEEDIKSVVKVLKSDNLTQGPLISTFESEISKYVGAKYSVVITSCTAGLHLASIISNMKKGKKLLTSPITFVATANSSLFCGAETIFADIDSSTINISIGSIKKVILKNKVHAIAPVHFGGLPCDVKKIKEIADKVGAIIYEDAAHAFGASFSDGSKVGSCKYSDMTVFSFHPVKSIATGEGGAITTNDKKIYEKLIRLRNHGLEKNQENFQLKNNFFANNLNDPWYYEMQELGYNYRITDIQCALGLSQLKKIDKFVKRRRELAKKYDLEFENLKNCEPAQKNMRDLSSNHLYVLKINFKKLGKTRADLMKEFKSAEIITQVHYIPVISHPYFKKKNYKDSNFPNCYNYYNSALSIPLFYDLTDKQQSYVIDQVKKLIG